MGSSPSNRSNIFISYSHADKEWLGRLRRHLKPWAREGHLDYWDDTHIRAGDDWRQEIHAALDRAQVAVLLISADFFASDFIDENELPPLLAAAQAEGVRILPVILSASRFARHPSLARFQAVNSPDRPLNDMPPDEQENVLDRLAQTIERAFVGWAPVIPRLEMAEKNPRHSRSHMRVLTDTEGANALLTPTECNTPIAVTITIDKNYATYTIGEANHLISRLSTLLELPKPARILNIEEGSVKITIEITIEQARKLLFLQKSGILDMLGIEDVVVIGDAVAAAIVARKRADGTYDVFMCHNADDKREVIRIGVKLRSRGILPWLDEWELRPGALWQKELESQICNIKSVAVFVGESGMGPWQNMEVDAFIRIFAQRQCPIIPAILRSCKKDPVIPLFLNGMTWVDFRKRNPDPYERLVWGITGENSLALSMR